MKSQNQQKLTSVSYNPPPINTKFSESTDNNDNNKNYKVGSSSTSAISSINIEIQKKKQHKLI